MSAFDNATLMITGGTGLIKDLQPNVKLMIDAILLKDVF